MTVELVQGTQDSLEWIETSVSFGILARPLEFLSSFKLKAPPLKVGWECWDSFPDEAGKGTLILR